MVSVLGVCGSCGVKKHLRYSIHGSRGCETGKKMCSACYERERLKRNRAKAEALKRAARSSAEDVRVNRHQHAQRMYSKKRKRAVDETVRREDVPHTPPCRVLSEDETLAAETLRSLKRASDSLTITLEEDGSDGEDDEIQNSRDDSRDGTGRVRNQHEKDHHIDQKRQISSPVSTHRHAMPHEDKTHAMASGERLISQVMELTQVARTLAEQVQAQQNELNACVQLQRTLAMDLRCQLRMQNTLGFSLVRQLISVKRNASSSRGVPC